MYRKNSIIILIGLLGLKRNNTAFHIAQRCVANYSSMVFVFFVLFLDWKCWKFWADL